MSIFGPIIDGATVEESVMTFLQRWLPTYLAEVARQNGLDPDVWLQPGNWPPSWSNKTRFDLTEETRLPAILVISAGLAGRPIKEGDGNYRATWMIGIAAIVSAKDQDSTNKLAKRYGAAIRWLMMQHPSMEDPNVEGVDWEDEIYDDIPPQQERTLSGVRLVFSVEYTHVMSALDGPVLPADPPPDPTVPYEDWPIIPDIDHVQIEVKETP